ncbi:MAG: electron transfer flavoprotein subunit beta/FixA family protein [Bdellovibrionales bacterium]|nr:electron transfer flavoprotein subunit beta/FixA family protein [Bdellovibrionales bacterium]
MRIFVCIKQVPDTETKIKLNASQDGIDESGIKWILNPYDEYAVEEALNLKAAEADSTVTVVSMGPKKRVVDSMRTALAMGADDGIVVDCEQEFDSATAAVTIAKVLKDEGSIGMIFTGMTAIDKNAGIFNEQLAEHLNLAHTNVVTKFSKTGDTCSVERSVEGGTTEVLELKTPAVVGATKGLNTPRYASLPGIMKAKKKPIKEIAFSDLGFSDTQKVKYINYQMPPEKPPVKMIEGDVAVQAKELASLLKNEAKVL